MELSLEGRTSGLFSWQWGYRNLFLCEYRLATKDPRVMPAILEYSTTIACGQSGVGTWGQIPMPPQPISPMVTRSLAGSTPAAPRALEVIT